MPWPPSAGDRPRDEPASPSPGEAGSVVSGDAFATVGEMFQRAADTFREVHEAVAQFALAFDASRRTLRETAARLPPPDLVPAVPFGPGDAMHWTPPADGEETPACPA